jgi:hypothetical protein
VLLSAEAATFCSDFLSLRSTETDAQKIGKITKAGMQRIDLIFSRPTKRRRTEWHEENPSLRVVFRPEGADRPQPGVEGSATPGNRPLRAMRPGGAPD